MKERTRTWKKYQQYKSTKNYDEYKKTRNEVNSLIRQDEDNIRKQVLASFKGKPKRFYGYMRSMQTVNDNVTTLAKEDGELTTTHQETADLLASYFKEAFTERTLHYYRHTKGR